MIGADDIDSSKKFGTNKFARAVARIAAAQVCGRLGFQNFHQSALDTLADVGTRYIEEIGRVASSSANASNRSHCNVFDVIRGLEDVSSAQGFSSASDVNRSISGSGVVKDLIRYVNKSNQIPFAYLIPNFPVFKESVSLNHSFAQAGENPPDEHIPSWLPRFPDPETYFNLSPQNTKDSELVDEQQSHRKVERPLLNFQQKIICNGGVEQGEDNNPFLAQPLQYGEKEVYIPVIPAKRLDDMADYHKSSEALEPSLRSRASVGHEKDSLEPEDRRKIILNGRPGVQVKFENGKRILVSIENVSVWFGDDSDANEVKKSKDDKILWEEEGFSPEVSQL